MDWADVFLKNLSATAGRCSFFILRFGKMRLPQNEKSPASDFRLKTPLEGELNDVGVAGDDAVERDAKLEVEEVTDVLNVFFPSWIFVALQFDGMGEYGAGK